MSQSLTERYDERIAGILSCYDRVVITGTIPVICYAEGMTRFLYAKGIRIFDYPAFAQILRDRVRDRAASLAAEAGVTIEHVSESHIRKEDVVARVLEQRGDHPGLVHIISAMEACDSYRPWHDKATGKTFVRPDSGKCLHYYFYFLDAAFGLVYLRVPTWGPFRLQFYCNGHNWLARKLTAEGIGYSMADNAFTRIGDWDRAQDLADELSPDALHEPLDRYADQCCPVSEEFGQSYHWSLMQVEYATDLVFRSRATLGPLYDQLIRETVLSVKAEQVATFLGRQITPQLAQEFGSQFSTRIQGTCVKHRFGASSIKMYDKFGVVLRIETTTNDVSFFGNCPGTPRWCPGTPSERRSVGEFALEKLAFRSLARPQAAFCGTTWAVTDYEYERNGTANLFMMFAPLEGWRKVKVTDRHAALDYAQVLKELSDIHFPPPRKSSSCRIISALKTRLRSTRLFPPQRHAASSSGSSGTTRPNTAVGSIWQNPNSAS